LVEEIISSGKTEELNVDELRSIIKKILTENPQIAKDFAKGKTSVVQFAIGQVMYIIKKKIDINIVRQLILEELK
jgi:Asp-tRNA(Asn)/Glu-tRNA(Gln) amidotransferase B subunit